MPTKSNRAETGIYGNKQSLNVAFVALRKAGYFAKQDFSCCSSCGWAEMTDKQSKKAVFYHGQDADGLKEDGSCYLSWSGDGKEIVKILRDNGVDAEWNGESGTRILITISKVK